MKDEIKFKRPETKIENILEKGKKLENFINSIYDNNLVIPQELNPFNIKTSREPQNDFDTLDKIELLEYSREMEMNTKEDKDREISQSNDTEQSERNFNIKDYDNFIFKIETLKISDEKTFKVLKDDLLYLECKVPLYANEGIYHDTFKIFNKTPFRDGIFNLSHVSYHKLNFAEENFGALASSNIELFLHRVDTRNNNIDTIIGKTDVEFNKILLAKDFFVCQSLSIMSFSPEVTEVKAQGKKQFSNANKPQTKQKVVSNRNPFKIGEVLVSCQLYRGGMIEKPLKKKKKESIMMLNDSHMQEDERFVEPQEKFCPKEQINSDCEEILIMFLKVTNLRPIDMHLKDDGNYNFFLSHKIFPGVQISTSDISWSTTSTVDFKYESLMPFTINQKTAEYLDTGYFVLELWNKSHSSDQLVGVSKLELRPLIEALKVDEDVISLVPILKNLFPLILYDDFFPVYSFESLCNTYYLHMTLGLGTSVQINNLAKKKTIEATKTHIPSQIKSKVTPIISNADLHNMSMSNVSVSNSNKTKTLYETQTKEKEDEAVEIASALNNKTEIKQEEINVEELLERNKHEIENLNKYKASLSALNESKNNFCNPFIVTKDEKHKEEFKVTNESNFYVEKINKIVKENNFILKTFEDANKVNGSMIEKEIKVKEEDHPDLNEMNKVERDVYSYNNEDNCMKEITSLQHNTGHMEQKELIKNQNEISIISPHLKHTFNIHIDKLINVQILSKAQKPFLRYKLLNDSSVRSEILAFSSFNKESSTIEVDLRSSHSLILNCDERITKHLQDFLIELIHSDANKHEVTIGRVNIPVEEFNQLLEVKNYDRTLFIYGTDKINRQDCIIGKIKLSLSYDAVEDKLDTSNLLIERQTVFNRKIPKFCKVVITLNYFKYDEKFLDIYDTSRNGYYFELDLLPEIKKKIPKTRKTSSKKYNSLNGIFEEEFSFHITMEEDLIDYFKSKDAHINLFVFDNHHQENFSDDSDYEPEQVGTGLIKLNEVLSSVENLNKIVAVTNDEEVLGYVNYEIRMENSSNEEEFFEKGKTLRTLDNLKTLMKQKADRNLNGKYFFVINLGQLIYDKDIKEKFQSEKFFFSFKFGNNIKRVTQSYKLSDQFLLSKEVGIFLNDLTHQEILEFNLNYSKNKPEDIIDQLREKIFEIKLYSVDDDDISEHMGSFMIDLSHIWECKTGKNIFASQVCEVFFFDNQTKQKESMKLSLSLTLIKCNMGYDEFLNFYSNTKSKLEANYTMIKSNYLNSGFKSTLKNLLGEDYSFIDQNLIEMENDAGKMILENFESFFFYYEIEGDATLTRNLLGNIKMKRSSSKTYDKYVIKVMNLKDLFNIKDKHHSIFDKKIKEYLNMKMNSVQFGVYNNNSIDRKHIDLFDLILFFHRRFNRNSRIEKEISQLSISVFSVINLNTSDTYLFHYENIFFNVIWANDKFTSNLKANTSNLNENFNLKLYEHDWEEKLKHPLLFEIFTRREQKDISLGRFEVMLTDLTLLLNDKSEYEDFFTLLKNNKPNGQLNVKFKFDEYLLSKLPKANQFNFTINLNTDAKCEKKNINKEVNNIDYKYDDLDTKELWERLNKNNEMILTLTKEIDYERKHSELGEGTLQKERRVTEKKEAEIDDNFLKNISMEFDKDDSCASKFGNNTSNIAFLNETDIRVQPLDYDEPKFDKTNRSVIEVPSIRPQLPVQIKRPPIPGLTKLYKTADKKLLNRIQTILKNKETKKLNYDTSEDDA